MALCDIFYTLSVTGDCGNNGTGIIRVDIEGEISPADYTIEWLTPFTDTIELGLGVSSYVVNYLTTGSYSFNIINTCSPENTVQLVTAYISSGNCSSITEVVHTTCGQDNGSISVTSENSYGDTTYTIYDNNDIEVNQVSTSALSYTFDGLSGGTYYVISDDGYGCTAKTQSCVVLSSTTIDYDFYVVGNSSCNTSSSLGKIYITGLTGTPPFTYLWTNGETTDYITGLTQGSYSVTVGDSTGCEVTKTTFITNVPRVGLGGFVTESPSCFNDNGSVTVFVTGGTSPYYFSGSNGTTIATFAKEYTFNNLAAGYFGVYVSDSGLCTFTSNTFLIPPNGFSIVNMNISGARCSNNGGSIDIQLNGGNLNITYTLEKVGGDTISTTTTSVNQLFNFLSAGEYILTIEGGDCIYTETIEIEDISTFDIFSGVTATTCNNDNGVVEFGMTGESTTGEYSIELEGLPTIFISLPTTGYTFTNLPAGDLTYTIIDIENSCLKEGTINIPQSPTVDFSFYKTESNCGNGSICVNITSGEPTFTLEWSDNVNGQTGLTITNLSADTYTLKVTDSNGCFKEKSIDINGTNGLSTYQVFNVCDLTFENNGEILKKGPKQMLLEGYYDLITGDENCILNSATFTASVTINGDNVSNLIYTTTSLYDYPSDQVWYDELDDIISSFEGIGSVIIDPETNKIVITTDCNSETDLGDASVVVDMIIDYDISCVACDTTTTTTITPTTTTTTTSETGCSCVGGEVVIGTQTWTCQNLDVTTYRNGDPIPEVTDPTAWNNLTTGAWCYYNNDSSNNAVYGKLYNWYAVNDPRGLAPTGYHIPTDSEWTVLTDYLGGLSVAGGKMKEVGTTHWSSPNNGATNSSCFTGLPGGYRDYDGTFYYFGISGYWLSSTDLSLASGPWYRGIGNLDVEAIRSYSLYNSGMSVRLIKD